MLRINPLDFVQSFGSLLASHWLVIDSIGPGSYCNFQFLVLNSGDLGSALWTLVVALSTFLTIAGGPRCREWVTRKSTSGKGRWVLTLAIWGFILFIGLIGFIFIQPFHPERGPYCIKPRTTFCTLILRRPHWGRLVLDRPTIFLGTDFLLLLYFLLKRSSLLVFVFVDMFVLIVLYSALFCYIRVQSKRLRDAESTSHQSAGETSGYELESGMLYKSLGKPLPAIPDLQPQIRRIRSRSNAPDRRLRKVSLTLLCYPLVYMVFLMPLSIARLQQFAGLNPSLTFTYAACAVFDCQGLVNVILYTSTRKGLIPWDTLRKIGKRVPQEDQESSDLYSDNRLCRKFPSRDSVISKASMSPTRPVPENSNIYKEEILESNASCNRSTTEDTVGERGYVYPSI